MAILSASRRTDIPTYYGEWFVNRLKEGYFMTRNPYNSKVSKISFGRSDVDCIVLWTKNPIPFIKYLDDIKNYPYYFQFTVTGYGKDMEKNLPEKRLLIDVFKELYNKGNGHIIWRYDPIVFTDKYTPEWHLSAFEAIARELCGYTEKCVISLVDIYPQTAVNMDLCSPLNQLQINLNVFARRLADIARKYGMTVATCGEKIDFDFCGIKHNKCIDDEYISKITGKEFHIDKDKGQRETCGCVESVEVGTYSTCRNGCRYCYANKDMSLVNTCIYRYDPQSPLLCDTLKNGEVFTERRLHSLYKEPELEQLTLF